MRAYTFAGRPWREPITKAGTDLEWPQNETETEKPRKKTHMRTTIIAISLLTLAPIGNAGVPAQTERDVQIVSVDFETNAFEVHNFGGGNQAVDGWRFCTHSASQARQYTNPAGLNGVVIPSGTSMFVYMDNDAPKGINQFNASDLGVFATSFGQGPYTIELFWPNGGSLSFGSTDDMVDHIQWSVNGVNNPVAATRSQQAVNAGLWNAANAWIVTSGNTESFSLIPAGGILHQPGDYQVNEPSPNCNDADIAAPFGVLDLADIGAFVTAFTSGGSDADIAAPFGVFDLADISAFVTAFTAGCP